MTLVKFPKEKFKTWREINDLLLVTLKIFFTVCIPNARRGVIVARRPSRHFSQICASGVLGRVYACAGRVIKTG